MCHHFYSNHSIGFRGDNGLIRPSKESHQVGGLDKMKKTMKANKIMK